MPQGRPEIPANMKRQLLLECGAVCAFPTCRQLPTEYAHIEEYAKVKEHEFANIIVLCRNHHGMHGERRIDKSILFQLKANLAVMNGRYSDLERRVLKAFAEDPDKEVVQVPGGFDLLLWHLLEDKIIIKAGNEELDFKKAPVPAGINVITTARSYYLTSEGRSFIDRWKSVEPLR